MRFEKGDTYHYIDSKGTLNVQSTVTSIQGAGKPPHRIRNRYNFIRPIVEAKISAATQRIPSYEITPTTTDPTTIAAASLSERVALYGYDQWRLRNVSLKTVKLAIAGGGDGFALPYFDPNVGPYEDPLDGGPPVGRGEIKILVLSGNEVYWEAGSTFEESPWYVVERARPIDDVMLTPGIIPGTKLAPDASTNDIPSDRDATDNLVMTSEYFERPSPRFTDGRCIVIANGKPIVDYRLVDPTCTDWWGPYPLQDPDGTVLDEPLLHRLSYTVDADTDRDFGLVWQLIDFQRTAQDCVAGDTLVQTAEGLRPARDLAGQEISTLAGDGVFRPARWNSYGKKELWRVTFDDGTTVEATQNHRWIVNRRYAGKTEEVTTPLLVGERVPYRSLKAHTPVTDTRDWWAGVQNGLMWGDGTVEHHKRGEREYAYGSIRQYSSDENLGLIERFFPDTCTERREYEGRAWIGARGIDPALKSVPSFDKGIDYLRGFLAGAIASDGTVSTAATVSICQSNRQELEAVATVARTVGIIPVGLHHQAKGNWILTLAKESFVDGAGVDENLILKPSHIRKLSKATAYRRVRTRRVVSVEPTGRVEETFCCEEPVTQSWVMGSGLITGNCVNKLLEWKNRCLNPQMIAAINQLIGTLDDVPGAVRLYRPIGGYPPPQWETPPPVPKALFDILEWTINAMAQVASDQQVDPAPNLAARTLEAGIEQSQNRWQSFLGDLAEWHSRLMRHCLLLVARYYTEPRLLELRGRDGWELVQDFRGAQLEGQTQVRVLPNSITPITRAGIQDQLTWINQNFPGFLNPEAAIAALEAGSIERLTQSYWLDVGKANTVIQKIMDGSVLQMPTRQDTMPDGSTVEDVSTYMPGPADNLNVWKSVFGDFLKTDSFERLEPSLQEVTNQIWSGIQFLETQRAQQQAAQQNAMASQLGMENAAKPQAKGMPSLPGSSTVPAAR
jgi:hypothetical protein